MRTTYQRLSNEVTAAADTQNIDYLLMLREQVREAERARQIDVEQRAELDADITTALDALDHSEQIVVDRADIDRHWED